MGMEQQPKLKNFFDMTLDLKTVVHLVTLIAALVAAFFTFQTKLESVTGDVQTIKKQTTRIEHYLSQSDSSYWRKTHDNGDSDPTK